MSFKECVWAIDPIGSLLFVGAATLLLLALDWAGGAYSWHDAQVAAPLAIGLGLLLVFCLYEWKGRSDGIVARKPIVDYKSCLRHLLTVLNHCVQMSSSEALRILHCLVLLSPSKDGSSTPQ